MPDAPSAPDHGKPWQSASAAAAEPRGETESPSDAAVFPDVDDAAPLPSAFMPASPSREIVPTMSNHDISLPAAMVSLAPPAGRGRRVEVYPAAQPQDGPQLHEGPQRQASGWLAQPQSAAALAAISGSGAHAQTGAQVQGLQVQVVFIGERLRFGLRWPWCTLRAGSAIERRG